MDQESPFYARSGNATEPDNEKKSAEELLASGEVGFAYVLWDKSMNSGTLQSESPLLMTFFDKRKSKFFGLIKDRERYLIVLEVDMSVNEYKANSKGVVMIDGKDYFDWSQPHWCGQKPIIVWPE